MSVDAMSWVIRHSPTTGTDRLVLMVLADYAGDEWEAYPSQETLRHGARLKRINTVQEVITRLVREGHLSRVVHGAPDMRVRPGRRANLYRILTDRGEPCRRQNCGWCAPPPNGGSNDELDPAGDAGLDPVSPRNSTPPNGARTINEPSLEPSREILPSSESPASRPEIDDLCDLLANAIAGHRGGIRPKITERWRKDMRLLVDRGPLNIDDPAPVSADRVRVSVAFVFTHLAEPTGRDGFCWADQIRSPHALRDHWAQLADAARRLRNRRRDPLAPATMETVADPLAGPQLALSRGGDGR